MNIFVQSLLVFGASLVVLGYFQYRKQPDIVSIVQEMARPAYLVPAAVIAICYIIIRLLADAFNWIL